MNIDLSKFTQAIQIKDRETAAALRMVENAINHLAKNTGSSPLGEPTPPAPIQALNLKVSGETAHATITDSSPISRNINYFLEYSNEPNFLAPHVEHFGTSRERVLNLPTNDDTGVAQSYYFRAYSQYPGSKPSARVNYGGQLPSAVQMNPGGTLTAPTSLTLLPSPGSGTAAANGEQGGQGFGKFLSRSAVQPKRSVST